MGILSNKVEKSEIRAGDHIYTYRALYSYSHHGIFVGDNKVVHFTSEERKMCNKLCTCLSHQDCGFRMPKSGVVSSCLDCFLQKGDLYRYEYGVTTTFFCAKVRGGTCTIAKSDGSVTVIHRAMSLLQREFGKYHLVMNNSEDFALYCKTGLLAQKNMIIGRSGQASSPIIVLMASLLSYDRLRSESAVPLVGFAALAAVFYCKFRYAADVGIRTDVFKVDVEDLIVNYSSWMDDDDDDGLQEESPENEASS